MSLKQLVPRCPRRDLLTVDILVFYFIDKQTEYHGPYTLNLGTVRLRVSGPKCPLSSLGSSISRVSASDQSTVGGWDSG